MPFENLSRKYGVQESNDVKSSGDSVPDDIFTMVRSIRFHR